MRVGFGYDSHRLADDRRLVIGGVEIPFERGLAGHSDADVLCHALTDAILGALGDGDIGTHFPDTDPAWKDADSIDLLARVVQHASDRGFVVLWADATIIAEQPRLAPYVDSMKQALSRAGLREDSISIKAKTNEGMGFIGQGEGIAAFAVCLIGRI